MLRNRTDSEQGSGSTTSVCELEHSVPLANFGPFGTLGVPPFDNSNRIVSAPSPFPVNPALSGAIRIRSSVISTVACLALGALLVGAPARVRAQTTIQDAGVVTLAPGDQMRIAVWGHPEFSGDFVISQDGVITHPLLREVRAVGVPMSQLEARIKTFLSRYVADPAFVITPLLHVFIGGEVRTPATYVAPPGTTMEQALTLAGGPVALGRLDSVVLVRDRRRTVLDLTNDGPTGVMLVHSGDQLFVPRVAESKSILRDVLVPTVGILAVLSGIANLIVTLNRR